MMQHLLTLHFNGTKLSGTNLEIDLEDGKKLRFGDSNDLEIVHDGGNSIIRAPGTGHNFYTK